MPVHAPYNFVPLSKKVFFPEWAEQVSQDIPFSDGISGEINCTLTAVSPIYVRNGGDWTREQIMAHAVNDSQSFFKVGNNEYLIPGTSLKGMLRNVIEIMSFGKMGRVDEHRYSVRDLQNPSIYGSFMTETVGPKKFKSKVKAAWLMQDTERKWYLIPCEHARVEREDLINFHPAHPNLRDRQGAVDKYNAWGNRPLTVKFSCSPEQPYPHSGGKQLVYKKVTQLGNNGQLEGTVVLTGQPAPDLVKHKEGRKHLEFIFYNANEQLARPLSDVIKKDFTFIHSDDSGTPNTEWGFWKQKLDAGQRVPVFYLGTIGAPQSIGLAMMYRLPYQNTIYDAIGHTSKDHFHRDIDLAGTMFGWEGEPEGLKGRVWVSQATASGALPGAAVTTIMNSPKPTYYPNYVEQPNLAAGYKTLMNSDGKLRGWKRYPTRAFNQQDVPHPGADQMNVATKFIPLNQGAKFTFKIKVHNLKPVELGALLWALEWGGDASLCHSLGMGKSYGYGQVKVSVSGAKLVNVAGAEQHNDSLMQTFVTQMDSEVGGGWQQTLQMHQLLAMANPAKAAGKTLRHMTIAPNQFVDGKKAKERLEPHITNNGLRNDEDRFRSLTPRPRSHVVATANSGNTQPQTIAPTTSAATEKWENVQLTFDLGRQEFGITGKKAMAKRTPELPLVADEVLPQIKNKGFVKATVTVEPCGGGVYRIIKAEPV